MGLYRKFNHFIFATIVANCLAIVILGVALGTPHWHETELSSLNSSTTTTVTARVYYGIFSGSKFITTRVGDKEAESYSGLKVVCLASEKVCMYSCGTDSDRRKKDILSLWTGLDLGEIGICSAASETREARATFTPRNNKLFLNYGLWIATIIFIVAGIGFSGLAGAQALYNTYRAPIQPIFSVFGLYVWNIVACVCTTLGMILWGVAFSSTLKEIPAVWNSISGAYDVSSSKLGYSFWILILADVLCLANVGILRYRTWKIEQIETKAKVVNTETTNPNSMIF